MLNVHTRTHAFKDTTCVSLYSWSPLQLLCCPDTQTELSYNTRKRKHNFSHFEIAVWQPAITLQIPGWRSNHGNFFQNTPAAQGGKKGSFAPLCLFPSLHCQWSGTPDADRDTFSDAPRDCRGPWVALSFLPPHPPSLTAFFPPTFLRGFPFPQAFNDTTLINTALMGPLHCRLGASLSLPPLRLPCRGGSSWSFKTSTEGACYLSQHIP